MKRTSIIVLARQLLAALPLALCAHAFAADPAWPAARPIRMVIPGGAGAGTDIFARLVGERLGKALQQTIVFDNKAGANGIIGNDNVAKAAPDGYTLLFSNASAIAVNPALHPKMPYQTLKDLVPVAQIGAGGVLLVVAPDIPARDMRSFVQYVQASPTPLSYGTWGTGSTGHLSMEALRAKENLKLTHVPYKTMGQMVADLLGGTIKIAFVDAASPMPFIKAGKLVPLGITGSYRVPALPALPTMQQQGYRLGGDGWYGLFVPANTPPLIVQRLHAEVNRILTTPEMRTALENQNMNTPPMKTSEEFAQTLREDIAQWLELARTAQVTLE